jgi:DNA-binding transcriptional ArsR family regulator
MNDNLLSDGLFGKTRQAVLALIYGKADSAFYTKQILDNVKIGRGTVQRELQNLTDAGIITREVQGRQVYYRANEKCPIFLELKGIVRKTFGMADVIRMALKPIESKIQAAFIYGSLASNCDSGKSDVDIMVIGEATFGDVTAALYATQSQLRREVNPTVYPTPEFQNKARDGHVFIREVLRGEKIFLIGDADGLKRLEK